MMKRILAIAALALLGLCAPAQSSRVTDAILEEGRTNNQTMTHLDVLSNRIGGRLIGSGALEDAENWVEWQLKQWGYKVIREQVCSVPVGFNRGPWFGKIIGGSGESLHFTTPSYTAGTRGVQRGRVVIEPYTTADFERMKGTVKGAWVLISGNNTGFPTDYGQKADSLRAVDIAYNDSLRTAHSKEPLRTTPALFYRQLIEAGALGLIQSSKLPISTLYDRKHLEEMSWESLPVMPDIRLDCRQYEKIRQMVIDREYFELEFDIRNHFRLGPVYAHNIIAVLEGSKYPNEYVITGGHLDAYDSATGGVDCGVGVSVNLEVARLLATAGAKPKRTIIIAFWTGEEFGLWGTKYNVEHQEAMLPRISNYFNRDGGPTMCTGISVPEAMYDDFKKVCAPLEKAYGFEVSKREGGPRPRPAKAGGSDHAHFAMKGVPTISFTQGDPKGYNFDYREIWHTDRDTYDKSIAEYQEEAAVVTAVTVWGLSNLDHILSREGLYSE